MKRLIPVLILFGCNINQNYDKSLLPDADPSLLSKVNSRGLITCMQIPVPQPPIPINKDHKIPQKEVYDSNDCIDSEMAKVESKKLIVKGKKRKNSILRLI